MAVFGCFRPFKRQVDNFSGCLDFFQRFQRPLQYGPLCISIACTTDILPKRVLDGSHARCADRGGQIGDIRQADRREASRFDLTLRQSNGPAADRSTGDENNHIHLLIL